MNFRRVSKARFVMALPMLMLLAGCGLLVCGCTVPGMRLNVTAQGNDEPYLNQYAQDAPNVEVFPISVQTIARMNDQDALAHKKETAAIGRTFDEVPDYRVGPQDTLRVTVWDHPELNNPSGTTTGDPVASGRVVAADGTMFYPYVGTIKVAGKTIKEIQAYIKTSLNRVIREPQVEVVLQTYKSQRIFIAGEVKTPGVQYLTDAPVYLSEAIAMAGGPTPDADLTHVSLTRDGKVASFDVYKEYSLGDLAQDRMLQARDVITVPEGRARRIFVMGELFKQGSFPLPPGKYSLTDALGDAGGILQNTSNPAQIYVIRLDSGKPVIFHLNARNPDALLVADAFDLHSRDVIYVEAAEVSRIGRVISQVLPVATALATGRTIAQ